MNKNKKRWVFSPEKRPNAKPSESEKESIQEYFQPLVQAFKKKCVKKNPDKECNYVIDVYSKWNQNNFYLCEKYKSEHVNRIADEFEAKVVRLKYVGKDCFDFSYFRHTGQWHLVAEGISLKECQEMILSNPNFQPL
ncbi:MAG: hypothetical protein EPN85_00325 [Bacteroidetes bacterium]|nr:MAG: hypothetical protein EPN85_00325 [Bacteroidota bacterium]